MPRIVVRPLTLTMQRKSWAASIIMTWCCKTRSIALSPAWWDYGFSLLICFLWILNTSRTFNGYDVARYSFTA